MEKNYHFLDIEINKPIYRKLSAIQYDNNSRYILVSVYSNFKPYDLTYATVKIYGIKKDKTVFFNNAKILDAQAGKFEIDLTEQCLAVAGDVEIQILILGANQERLSSNSFILNVKKTLIDSVKVTSQDQWGILTEGLANLAEYDVYKNNVTKHDAEIKNNLSEINILNDKINDLSLSPSNFGAKFDGENDDSKAINDTIKHLEKNGGGRIILPSKTIKCNSKIVLPYGISIEGVNKGFHDRGTILYRDEIINNEPIIEIGTGGSVPMTMIKNISICGSSIDNLNHGIVNNSVGLHGLLLENINFIHMAGTPIIINSDNEDARAEFIDIINCRSGIDWEGLKQVEVKCTNNVCTGVDIRGNADSVRISRCNFVGKNKKAIGIKISNINTFYPGDLFIVEKCAIYGNDVGIFSNAREIEIKNNYIENNTTSIRLKTRPKNFIGEVITTISNNMFTSTSFCIDLIDTGEDARKSIHGTINNNYVINKWDGIDTRFIKTLQSANFTRIHCFANGFTEVIEDSGTIKFFADNSNRNGIFGQTKLDDFKLKYNLNSPKIFNDVTNNFFYEFTLNATDETDYGLVLNNSDSERLLQIRKNSESHYYFDGATRHVAYEMSSNGNVYFRKGISLYGTNGNRYELRINSSGQLELVDQG